MSANQLGILTPRLSPLGQQRLFEFLEVVDTATAARFRGWLGAASEPQVGAAAELLNRAGHGRDFAAWWRAHDRIPTARPVSSPEQSPLRASVQQPGRPPAPGGANRDVTVGAVWLLGGLMVTVVSYLLAASSPGGGHYLIAWGAMLYGAVRFFRGLSSG